MHLPLISHRSYIPFLYIGCWRTLRDSISSLRVNSRVNDIHSYYPSQNIQGESLRLGMGLVLIIGTYILLGVPSRPTRLPIRLYLLVLLHQIDLSARYNSYVQKKLRAYPERCNLQQEHQRRDLYGSP